MCIHLNWQKFQSFFHLYDELGKEPCLIYVIGETHHCYIGSVGSRGGKRGLTSRYERQYIQRAKAIFGLDEPYNQPAFAAILNRNDIPEMMIAQIEQTIQKQFIKSTGLEKALFTPRGKSKKINVIHEGNIPSFLH